MFEPLKKNAYVPTPPSEILVDENYIQKFGRAISETEAVRLGARYEKGKSQIFHNQTFINKFSRYLIFRLIKDNTNWNNGYIADLLPATKNAVQSKTGNHIALEIAMQKLDAYFRNLKVNTFMNPKDRKGLIKVLAA